MTQFERAQEFRTSGSFAKAEEALLEVERIAPTWTPVLFNLALMARAQGHYGDEIVYLERYRPYSPQEDRPGIEQSIVAARGYEADKQLLARKSKGLRTAGAVFTFLLAPVTIAGGTVLIVTNSSESAAAKGAGAGLIVGGAALVAGGITMFVFGMRAQKKLHPPRSFGLGAGLVFEPASGLRLRF